MKKPEEEWIKTLEDGRKAKFIYQELPEGGAFMTAQLAGSEVVYSVVLAKAKKPLRREDVDSRFNGELSEEVVTLKRWYRESNREFKQGTVDENSCLQCPSFSRFSRRGEKGCRVSKIREDLLSG